MSKTVAPSLKLKNDSLASGSAPQRVDLGGKAPQKVGLLWNAPPDINIPACTRFLAVLVFDELPANLKNVISG